jgi:hypothetical protein
MTLGSGPTPERAREDKALLEACLARRRSWSAVATRAIAVVPVGGKKNLDKLSAILTCLHVPHFIVFDCDGERNETREQVERWNMILERLAGVDVLDPMPATGAGARHAVFAPDMTKVVSEEMGADAWWSLRDEACLDLRVEVRRDSAKNHEILRIMLDRAAAAGMSSPSLLAATDAIVQAIERDLGLADRPGDAQ